MMPSPGTRFSVVSLWFGLALCARGVTPATPRAWAADKCTEEQADAANSQLWLNT